MKRAILPARPLRLGIGAYVPSALGALLVLGMAIGAGVGATWFASSGGTILRDREVWARGIPADGSIDGKRHSKLGLSWLIANYEGSVRYTDTDGARFEGTIDFWTMFGGPDTDHAELRYDPDNHARFAVSWGVAASGARWRATIVMTALLALLALAALYGSWVIVGDARMEATIATAGDEIQLRVVSATPVTKDGQPTGKYEYVLELDDGTKPHTIRRTTRYLLHVAPDDARVLALWTPGKPDQVVVIEHSLAPLAMTTAERAEVGRRAEAARAG